MYNKNMIGKQLITEIKMTQKPNDLTEIDIPMMERKHLDASDPRVQAGVQKFAEYMAKKRGEETLKSINLPRIEKGSDIFNIPTSITDEQAQAFLNGLDKMPKMEKAAFVEMLTSLVVPMLDVKEKDDLSKVDLPKMDIADKDAPFASVVQALDPNNPEVKKNVLAAAKQIAMSCVALSTIIINKKEVERSGAFSPLAKNKEVTR